MQPFFVNQLFKILLMKLVVWLWAEMSVWRHLEREVSDPSWSLGCALTVNPNFTSSSPLVVTLEEEEEKGQEQKRREKNEDQDAGNE